MSLDPLYAESGFQTSETSHASLTLYGSADDSILLNVGQKLEFNGLSERDSEPCLISLTTTKTLGAAAGSWSAEVKMGRGADLEDLVVDDQWVDITLYRWGRPFATMRGSLDRITKSVSVTAKGTEVRSYTLTGRDFGKQFDMTPIWFNQWADENVLGAAALRVIDSVGLGGDVATTVKKLLFGFLEELDGLGRANWEMPATMPNVQARSGLVGNLVYDSTGYTDDPPRQSILPNFMDPGGKGVWSLAQEWSDPAFCELWCDTLPVQRLNASNLAEAVSLTPKVDFGRDAQEVSFDEAWMCVVLRDRPFPTLRQGRDSPWFSLPLAEVSPYEVTKEDLSRGGDERYNAYFVAPQVIQELMLQSSIDITAPLWDSEDMKIHGIRRFDVNSSYIVNIDKVLAIDSQDGALLTLSKNQRLKSRDWYCLNPYLWSGSIQLGHGRPDIRVGTRLKIPGKTPAKDFTAYVEQVSHTWSLRPGIRTSIGVTRGWRGSDDAYLDALRTLAARYTDGKGQNIG